MPRAETLQGLQEWGFLVVVTYVPLSCWDSHTVFPNLHLLIGMIGCGYASPDLTGPGSIYTYGLGPGAALEKMSPHDILVAAAGLSGTPR